MIYAALCEDIFHYKSKVLQSNGNTVERFVETENLSKKFSIAVLKPVFLHFLHLLKIII